MEGQPDFLSSLHTLEPRAEKCIELRVEYLEQISSLFAVACSLPGRSKDLSAPPRKFGTGLGTDNIQFLLQCRQERGRVSSEILVALYMGVFSGNGTGANCRSSVYTDWRSVRRETYDRESRKNIRVSGFGAVDSRSAPN